MIKQSFRAFIFSLLFFLLAGCAGRTGHFSPNANNAALMFYGAQLLQNSGPQPIYAPQPPVYQPMFQRTIIQPAFQAPMQTPMAIPRW